MKIILMCNINNNNDNVCNNENVYIINEILEISIINVW